MFKQIYTNFVFLLIFSVTRGQNCASDAVFPRIFGVTSDISVSEAGKDIIESKMAYISDIDTLVVASRSYIDPMSANYGDLGGWDSMGTFDPTSQSHTLLSIYPTHVSKQFRQPFHAALELSEESYPLNVSCLQRSHSTALTDADFQNAVIQGLNQAGLATFDKSQHALCIVNIQTVTEQSILSLPLVIDVGSPEGAHIQVGETQEVYYGVASGDTLFADSIISVHKESDGSTFLVAVHAFHQSSTGQMYFDDFELGSPHGVKSDLNQQYQTKMMALTNTRQIVTIQKIRQTNYIQVAIVYEYDFTTTPISLVKRLECAFAEFATNQYSVTAIAEVDTKTLQSNGGQGTQAAPDTSFYIGIANSQNDGSSNSHVIFLDFIAKTSREVRLIPTGPDYKSVIKGLQCSTEALFKCSVIGQYTTPVKHIFFVQMEEIGGTFIHKRSLLLQKEADNFTQTLNFALPFRITNDIQSFIYAFNTKKQAFWRNKTLNLAGVEAQTPLQFSNYFGGLVISANSAADISCDKYLGWVDTDNTYYTFSETAISLLPTFNGVNAFELTSAMTGFASSVTHARKEWYFGPQYSGAPKLELPIFGCQTITDNVAIKDVYTDETLNCELSGDPAQFNLINPQLSKPCKNLQFIIPRPTIANVNSGTVICREKFSLYVASVKFAADDSELSPNYATDNNVANECALVHAQGFDDPLKCKALKVAKLIYVDLVAAEYFAPFKMLTTDGTSDGVLSFGALLDNPEFKGVELKIQFQMSSERFAVPKQPFKFTIGVKQPQKEFIKPSFSLVPPVLFFLETPIQRQIYFGVVIGNAEQVSVSVSVDDIDQSYLQFIDYERQTNIMTLTSKEEYFTTTYAAQVEQQDMGLLYIQMLEFDLKIVLTDKESYLTRTYESKISMKRLVLHDGTQLTNPNSQSNTVSTGVSRISDQTSTSSQGISGNSARNSGQSMINNGRRNRSNSSQIQSQRQVSILQVKLATINRLASTIREQIGLNPQDSAQIQRMVEGQLPPAKRAVFDLQYWIQRKQLEEEITKSEVYTVQKNDSFNLSQIKTLKNLEETFVVPNIKTISQIGQFGIKLSNKIQVFNFDQMIKSIQNNQNRKLSANVEKNNDTQLSKIDEIDALFKAAGLILVKLIPGGELKQKDSRNFDWKLKDYKDDEIEIQIKFERPELISVGEYPDKIEILFNLTQSYLEPVNKNLQSIPDGFKVLKVLPPQRDPEELYVVEEVNVKENLQGFVITQFLMAFLLNFSLQTIFSAILSFQILAYLPLLNVPIPGEAYLFFETLAAIVSFDILPVFDYWDAGFTGTDALTPGFQLLKFESLNFVESMGSVLIIGVMMFFYPILALLLTATGLIYYLKSTRQNFESLRIKQSIVGFMYGSAFDIIISVSLAIHSFELLEVFNRADFISNVFMVVFGVLLILFMVFIFRFSLVTSKQISTKAKAKLHQDFGEIIDKLHFRFKSKHSMDETEIQQINLMVKQKSLNTQRRYKRRYMKKQETIEAVISNKQHQKELLLQKAKNMNEIDIDMYLPMISGLKQEKNSAMIFPFMFILRRFAVLAIILFLRDFPGIQVMSFVSVCLFNVTYLCFANPFISNLDNMREVFQEFCLLECAILYMMINDQPNGSKQTANIAYSIIVVAIIDVLPVLVQTAFDTIKFLIQTLKQKYRRWKLRKTKEKKMNSLLLEEDSQFGNDKKGQKRKQNFTDSSFFMKFKDLGSQLSNNEVKNDSDLEGKKSSSIDKLQDNLSENLSQKSIPQKLITQKLTFQNPDLYATHRIQENQKWVESKSKTIQKTQFNELAQPEYPLLKSQILSEQMNLKKIQDFYPIVEKIINTSNTSELIDIDIKSISQNQKNHIEDNPDPENIVINIGSLDWKIKNSPFFSLNDEIVQK